MVTGAGAELLGQGLRKKDTTGSEFVIIRRPAVDEGERIETTPDPQVEAGELHARLAEVAVQIHHRAGHHEGALEARRGA